MANYTTRGAKGPAHLLQRYFPGSKAPLRERFVRTLDGTHSHASECRKKAGKTVHGALAVERVLALPGRHKSRIVAPFGTL